MVDSPARVHCDADALKSFVTHINSKLYVSKAKRAPCTESTWYLLLAGLTLFEKFTTGIPTASFLSVDVS